MRKLASALITASVALAAPVFAQGPVQNQNIILKVDAGSVLTSTGGEFVSANSGQQVMIGEKLLINTGSNARLVYDRGNNEPTDDCVIDFRKPGVYNVPTDCKMAVAWTGGGTSQVGNAAIIVGTGLVLAALIGNSSDNNKPTPPPPMSLGNL